MLQTLETKYKLERYLPSLEDTSKQKKCIQFLLQHQYLIQISLVK